MRLEDTTRARSDHDRLIDEIEVPARPDPNIAPEDFEIDLDDLDLPDQPIETDLVETPLDAHDVCLNPGREEAPRNPLCPVCEAEIRPIANDVERRFVCDCEVIWQFRFRDPGEREDVDS